MNLRAMVVLLLIMILARGLWYFHPHDEWTVRPADEGKWRSCLTQYDYGSTATSCGSPVTLDEAEWWSRTKGGQL
jgi:hypothetical protein